MLGVDRRGVAVASMAAAREGGSAGAEGVLRGAEEAAAMSVLPPKAAWERSLAGRLWSLALLVVGAVANVHYQGGSVVHADGRQSPQPGMDSAGSEWHSVKCYSCMSGFYKGLWPRLKETYTPPRNFSDQCDKDASQKGIRLVDCPSICINMWEETIIGGYPVLGFIRGCYDTMLRRGFNQTLVRWYRWLQRDSCHYYPRKDVLQLPFNMPGHIYICTCYADGCNGTPTLSGASSHLPSQFLLLSLLLLLGLLLSLRRTGR